MKISRYILKFSVLFSMLLSLCACGGNNTAPLTTEAPEITTDAPEITTEAPTEAKDGYKVIVVDENGTPIAGAMVQMCLESCFPGVTNADGVVEFNLAEAEYKVTFINLPAGYTYSTEDKEFYFEDGSKEMTIQLKKAE